MATLKDSLTEEQEREIRFVVSKFNYHTGANIWWGANATVKKALEVITDENYNRSDFVAFIGKYCEENKENADFIVCCEKFVIEMAKKSVDKQVQFNVDTSLNFLGGVVTQMLSNMKMDEIKDKVSKELEIDVQKFIFDNYGPIQRKIEIQIDDKKTQLEGVLHSKFETVLKFVKANEPVFLTGPAGSGKNVICQQVAKTLGLDFYFSNAVTQEYKLTGFTDANGTFHESQFYKAFKNGGVFMLDEMDASIPEVLIILNAAIANRYFDFPAPIGYVEANENFRVIAAGNTFGNGADYDYVGRSQLDAASLDRFAMVRIDYDSRIEESCAQGDEELLGFCRAFRKASQKAGIRTVVSYRAINRMAKLTKVMDADEVLDTCLIKSLELDDLKVMENDLAGFGKYSAGYRKVIEARKTA